MDISLLFFFVLKWQTTLSWAIWILIEIATRARARATFACALAFACRSFKLAPRAKASACDRKKEEAEQQRKRFLNSGDVYYFRYNYLVWKPSRCDLGDPKFQNFPGGASPQTPLKRACFTLTFRTLRSTVYVTLPVPEQRPYSGYATAIQQYLYWHLVQNVRRRVRGSQTQTLVVSPFEAYLKPFYS